MGEERRRAPSSARVKGRGGKKGQEKNVQMEPAGSGGGRDQPGTKWNKGKGLREKRKKKKNPEAPRWTKI